MLGTIQFRIFCLPNSCQKNLNIKIYNIVLLPVVLCGFPTLWEEQIEGV